MKISLTVYCLVHAASGQPVSVALKNETTGAIDFGIRFGALPMMWTDFDRVPKADGYYAVECDLVESKRLEKETQ